MLTSNFFHTECLDLKGRFCALMLVVICYTLFDNLISNSESKLSILTRAFLSLCHGYCLTGMNQTECFYLILVMII
jgi:hypothetical protein